MFYRNNSVQKKFITEIELKEIAPSVFGVSKSPKTSEKYSVIPTIDSVKGLADIGFLPIDAKETRSRDADNRSYSKHMIRFRQENSDPINGLHPEIVLVNSHDGSSSYQIRGGLYRMVCSNGLIIGNDYFLHKVRHQGDVVSKVVGSASQLVQDFPRALQIADKWQGIELAPHHKQAFAQAALCLKWDKEDLPIAPTQLLEIRRDADRNSDLWTTYNVIQENLIKGGKRYWVKGENGNRRQKTRAVNSVSENTRLNTALWTLTESLAEKLAV